MKRCGNAGLCQLHSHLWTCTHLDMYTCTLCSLLQSPPLPAAPQVGSHPARPLSPLVHMHKGGWVNLGCSVSTSMDLSEGGMCWASALMLWAPPKRPMPKRVARRRHLSTTITSWRKLKESDPYYTRPSYLWPHSPAFCTLCLCLSVTEKHHVGNGEEGRFCHWGRVGFQKDFPDSGNNWLKIHLLNCKCLHLLTLSHYIWRVILIGENTIY